MSVVSELVRDMAAEADSLDRLVTGLAGDEWRRVTPAPGWTIAHQIAHLAWTDEVAHVCATEPQRFDEILAQAWGSPNAFVDDAADALAALPPSRVLDRWRASRQALARVLPAVPDGVRLRWFGPPMSAASMATARLMEIWAHGLDVADALGVTRASTDRIRAVAHLGVRTRDFAYAVNTRTPPSAPFRVELTAPSGAQWLWGPDDAVDRVVGSAEDFCALVTQRRARSDLDLRITGHDADEWADIAQCFAGPPGSGRPESAEPRPIPSSASQVTR